MIWVSKSEAKHIVNKYIDRPWNTQKATHLCLPFNEVKLRFKFSDFVKRVSPRCGVVPTWISKFILKTLKSATFPRCELEIWKECTHFLQRLLVSSMCILTAALAAGQAKFGVLSWIPRANLGGWYLEVFALFIYFYLFQVILQALDILHHS